jgi:hypothetical protein
MHMTTIAARRGAGVVGIVAALTLVPTGVAVAADTPAPSVPAVSISLKKDKATVTGADKLGAGWVTFTVRTDSTARSLWLYSPKPNVSKAEVAQGEAAVRKVGAAEGQSEKEAAAAKKASAAKKAEAKKAEAPAKRAAGDAATAEKSLLALGGVFVAAEEKATFMANLPQGEVRIVDLADKDAKAPLAVLAVGGPGKQVRPAAATGTVVLDDSSRIQAPEKLKRSGQLLITNAAASKWHFIGLQKLAKGVTEKDLATWFDKPDAKRKSPFDPKHSAAGAPLSGGRSQYLGYDLPAGKYALIDAWVDPDTGRFHAAQGGTRIVTLK